ncbi:MAG: alpha/beta fold hydrolase, partial [Candidatus Saccharibacteria bacterium]
MTLPITLNIEGEGQPFIWLHGMLNSVESDSLYSLIDLNRVAQKVKVIRYDACGKSVEGDYRWDSMTNHLEGVIESGQYEPVILGGCSMGSVTALHYAVKYPEKVKALILVTPPPAWE